LLFNRIGFVYNGGNSSGFGVPCRQRRGMTEKKDIKQLVLVGLIGWRTPIWES
jgi:hypothetical protein